MIKKPVWGKGKLKEKNCTLAFIYDFSGEICDEIQLSVTASNIYKLYIDNTLLGYGPARAAHGFSRVDEYSFKAEKSEFRITVEVVSYQVNSYYLIMEDPFLIVM